MDFVSIYRLLVRQKYVVIPATLIVAALLYLTVVSVPPTYRASSSMVLLNPPNPPDIAVGETRDPSLVNPFVLFGDISVVVDIVHRLMESDPVVRELQAAGLDGTYTVEGNVNFARGPLIEVASESPTAEGAINNVNLVAAEITNELSAIQGARGTNPTYFITVEPIVAPTRATRVFSATLRRLIAVGALGVGFTLAIAITADTWTRRRRRRRAGQQSDRLVLHASPTDGRVRESSDPPGRERSAQRGTRRIHEAQDGDTGRRDPSTLSSSTGS